MKYRIIVRLVDKVAPRENTEREANGYISKHRALSGPSPLIGLWDFGLGREFRCPYGQVTMAQTYHSHERLQVG